MPKVDGELLVDPSNSSPGATANAGPGGQSVSRDHTPASTTREPKTSDQRGSRHTWRENT